MPKQFHWSIINLEFFPFSLRIKASLKRNYLSFPRKAVLDGVVAKSMLPSWRLMSSFFLGGLISYVELWPFGVPETYDDSGFKSQITPIMFQGLPVTTHLYFLLSKYVLLIFIHTPRREIKITIWFFFFMIIKNYLKSVSVFLFYCCHSYLHFFMFFYRPTKDVNNVFRKQCVSINWIAYHHFSEYNVDL